MKVHPDSPHLVCFCLWKESKVETLQQGLNLEKRNIYTHIKE